jgi:hypothetical protein
VLRETGESHSFKHFRALSDAEAEGQYRVGTGQADHADIFSVEEDDARTAIDACKKHAATYVRSCVPHPTPTQIEIAQQRAEGTAWKAGAQAVLKFFGLADKVDPPLKRRKIG